MRLRGSLRSSSLKGAASVSAARLIPAVCAVLLAAIFAQGCTDSRPAADPNSRLRAILLEQAARYPSMREQDVYKLLYQAALGPAHAAIDQRLARLWMDREIVMLRARRALAPLAGEPLLEEIDPLGQLVRVNLRPFLAAGGSAASLADAFAQTATEFSESPTRLDDYLAAAVDVIREGVNRLDPETLGQFAAEKRAADYPALHHSPEYESAHIPAYRVVLRRLVPPARDP